VIGRLGRFVVAAVALVMVAGGWRAATLPAPYAPAAARPGAAEGAIRVAYHIHTRRSDGTGTPEEIARAARDAGIDAVILTDHGDATRVPDPPRRLHDVLVVEAVEVSTWGGHYVALGAAPAPYPLAGEPDAVAEDVARLGGMGVAAHPGSSKDGLRWRGWDAPFDGLEWLNADSEWRDRPRDLWAAFASYPWSPVSTIAAMLDRPAAELRAWDDRLARRTSVGLAAHDAHARLGLRGMGEPYDGAVAVRAPWYTPMFRAFSNVVQVPPGTWGRSAAADWAALLTAVRAGRVYTVVTGRGTSWVRTFRATSGTASAGMGGHLVPEGPVRFQVDVEAPPSATTSLVCGGRRVARAPGGRLDWTSGVDPPGACRAEVALDDPEGMPWVVTNPIYARPALAATLPAALEPAREAVPMAGSGDVAGWTREVPAGASGTLTVPAEPDGAGRVRFEWRLGAEPATFAAAALPVAGGLAGADRLSVRIAASRPMRVWLQLRRPAAGGQRWGRSVYAETTPRMVTVPLASLLPLDGQGTGALPLAEITALLVVVDTVHHRPGSAGAVTVDGWTWGR
jgi:hypothetical protein